MAKTTHKTKEVAVPEPKVCAWEDGRRFPVDALLRDKGFTILYREGRRGPIWERQRRKYAQEEALALVDKNDVANAEENQQLYYRVNIG